MSTDFHFSIKSLNGDYQFDIDGETTIGRDSSCGAVVPDKSLSRVHARLFVQDEIPYVEDLNSTNGTYVNGKRLKDEPKAIRYNDVIRFDRLEFQVLVEPGKPQPAAEGPAEVESSNAPGSSEEIVAEGIASSRRKAPRSWAVGGEQAHGTVVLDLGFPGDTRQADSEDQVAADLEQALAKRLDQPALIGIKGVDRGKTITLVTSIRDRTIWQMGRDPEMDIVIDDPRVSEHQAQIIYEQGTWKLVDVISTNATYVNGNKILAHYLSNGDTFTFGPVQYMFRVNRRVSFSPGMRRLASLRKNRVRLIGAVVLVTGLLVAYFLVSN